MPRQKPEEPTQQVALRLPVSLIRRADAYAATLAKDHLGLQVTRTDAMRMVLAKHLPLLPEEEREPPSKHGAKSAPKRAKRSP